MKINLGVDEWWVRERGRGRSDAKLAWDAEDRRSLKFRFFYLNENPMI